jgi:hypothetical protein
MSRVKTLVRVVVGLLMDDAALAVAVLAIVATSMAASALGIPATYIAALLPAALLLVLGESVDRACRAHRDQPLTSRDDEVE